MLILALILLVVGGLILGPLLGLMSTGLAAGQVYEKKTAELYAADAGIEDALWKIKHNQIPTAPYLLNVNEKDVWVTIETTDAQQFVLALLGLEDPKNWVHSDWVVIGRVPEDGIAEITISWNGSGIGKLTDVGIWLSGSYSYVDGQSIPADDIRAEYPVCTFEEKDHGGGTAFVWTWPKGKGPNSEDTPIGALIFQFTPESTPDLSIAFTMMGRQNVGLSYDGSFNLQTITAVATTDTGSATADIGSQTTIVARVTKECTEVEILNWSIS